MSTKIEETRKRFAQELSAASTQEERDRVKNRYLSGPKCVLRGLFGELGRLSPAQKADGGRALNALKGELEEACRALAQQDRREKEHKLPPDPSLPGRLPPLGRRHPVTQTMDDVIEVFARLGFDVVHGPEIENERNNFQALNIPLDHPSRDAFDTFYLEPPWLLRSHTSPVQVRTMLRRKPPIRVIAPGKVFRPDKADASHLPMFHQVEGLAVGEGVTFAQLKGVLLLFAESMFGVGTQVRFRPSFFPFTEPSAEVDISCFICGAKGCSACKGSGWMEILGAGMVHPHVFEAVGLDPGRFTGFAFGMGIERICMLRHGVADIRYFLENHLRFLEQF
ncbi:MAG: phenylalanine--tRNA ligase subunit alpha [Planctomycetes bacterium]|nr:phenylalanine--tRNA ligase subunit alpha [Planctomycetota bacterium]